jgi:hypothetical protein
VQLHFWAPPRLGLPQSLEASSVTNEHLRAAGTFSAPAKRLDERILDFAGEVPARE